MPARPLAVVTGASSGIGRALALRLAREGYDLVLVSRDAARLEDAAARARESCAAARVVAEDLSKPGAAARVAARLEGPVDVLVNNAGFGLHGSFWETDAAQEQAMIQTHVVALLELTRALLPGMIARRRGSVVHIGSLYSYAPVPYQAVYGATKAFLLSFSESLNGELAGTGVRSVAVLPGLTRTEFRSRAGIVSKRLKGMSAEEVADAAYEAMVAGRRIVVPGAVNKLFVGAARLLPAAAFSALMLAVNRFRGLSPAR